MNTYRELQFNLYSLPKYVPALVDIKVTEAPSFERAYSLRALLPPNQIIITFSRATSANSQSLVFRGHQRLIETQNRQHIIIIWAMVGLGISNPILLILFQLTLIKFCTFTKLRVRIHTTSLSCEVNTYLLYPMHDAKCRTCKQLIRFRYLKLRLFTHIIQMGKTAACSRR